MEKRRFGAQQEKRKGVLTALAAVALVVFPGPEALTGKRVAPPPEVFVPIRDEVFVHATPNKTGRV